MLRKQCGVCRSHLTRPHVGRRRRVSRKSYNDTVDPTNVHNHEFFVYYLGNYLNKPLFCCGETCDLMSLELRLKSTLPFFERITTCPIEEARAIKSRLYKELACESLDVVFSASITNQFEGVNCHFFQTDVRDFVKETDLATRTLDSDHL